MKVYKYWDYIGSLSEIESHVEYYENNDWNCEPVSVNADIIRIIDTRTSPNVPVLIKNNRSRYNTDGFKDIIAANKKNDILVIYNNQYSTPVDGVDRNLDVAIGAAKYLGYNEIYIKTLDINTYLWKCERV